MQGATTRRDLLRRLTGVVALPVGFALGGLALSLVLAGAAAVPAPWPEDRPVRAALLVVAAAALGAGDLWAIRWNRLYPLGPRRQARQRLLFTWHRPWAIGVVWGTDAGFSLATYRVTSGLWVLLVFVLTGHGSPWAGLVYAAGFVLGFAALVTWLAGAPSAALGDAGGMGSRRTAGSLRRARGSGLRRADRRFATGSRRREPGPGKGVGGGPARGAPAPVALAAVARARRAGQLGYLLLLPAAVIAAVLGG